MKPINVIGNSHAWFFTGQNKARGVRALGNKPFQGIPEFRVFPLGAATAWAFTGKHLPVVKEIIKANDIQEGDPILFVLGEVDCRWHIPRNMDMWDSASECASRYAVGLCQVAQYFDVCVWGVHPQIVEGHSEDGFRWGSKYRRNKATTMFNARLREVCSMNNIKFVSIYYSLMARETESYYVDDIHLGQKAMPLAKME